MLTAAGHGLRAQLLLDFIGDRRQLVGDVMGDATEAGVVCAEPAFDLPPGLSEEALEVPEVGDGGAQLGAGEPFRVDRPVLAEVEDKLVKQTELAKSAFETALANVRELGGLVQKTSDEAVSVISKRVVDNFDEMKSALQPRAVAKK